MKRFILLALLVICFSIAVFAQSGRRVKAQPQPTPVLLDEDIFSESRPYKPIRIYPPNYKDKNSTKDKNKDKKEKKAKEQVPASVNTADDGDDIINIEATLVTIPVSIHSKNGLYISDVRQEEVKIFEDGKEQEIAYFKTSEEPFTVALLIDTSPSTKYDIQEIRSAAKAFVGQLKSQDKVLVMEFDGNPQVLSEATTDRQKIYKAIDKADFGDGTALYDAVDYAVNKRLNAIEGRKAIVLFTDGVDTVSRKKYDQNIRDAEESDAIIFSIYYNTFLNNQRNGGIFGSPLPIGGGRNVGLGTSSEEYALGKRYLEDLTASTGGKIFEPDSSSGGLTRAFENIAEELRRQYNVAYYPADTGKIGERKKIKVRIYRPDLVIRARDSYIVGSEK